MPELPEAETIVRGLVPFLADKRIIRCDVRRRDLRVPVPADLPERCVGQKVIKLSRRAKYALIGLEGGETLALHFGMSGKVLCARAEDELPQARHEHVRWVTQEGTAAAFVDPRRFGMIGLYATDRLHEAPPLKDLGAEPLDPLLTDDAFHEMIAASGRAVRSVIMDAHVIVGVGNIYASEALFAAGILPERKGTSLSFDENRSLLSCIRMVLCDAIASGGSTLRDYVRPSGEAGYFKHAFKVYGREGQPCLGCGSVILRKTMSNRSVFFCPLCQR